MTPAVVTAVLGAAGLGAIVAAIIAGLFSKRKLGAEATEIITKAAAGVVTNLQGEIDRQIQLRRDQAVLDKTTMQAMIENHDRELENVRRVLQLHVAWDVIAITKMAELGIILPDAPPLLPPRFDDGYPGRGTLGI